MLQLLVHFVNLPTILYKAKIISNDEEIIENSSNFEWTEEEDVSFQNLEDPLPNSFLNLLNSLDIEPADNCD